MGALTAVRVLLWLRPLSRAPDDEKNTRWGFPAYESATKPLLNSRWGAYRTGGDSALPMTNEAAVNNAQVMIQLIRDALTDGLAEYNTLQANAYIVSLLECTLIDRAQFESLMVDTRAARGAWTSKKGKRRHL